jgi:hypothetical protein
VVSGADVERVITKIPDEASRDAAFRQIAFRMSRGLPNGVVYTAGDAVIEVNRFGDYGTVSDLNRALEDAGAL